MKIKRYAEEDDSSRYMFYKNLEQIKRQCEEMLNFEDDYIDDLLEENDWISDHISTSKESIDQVYDFFMNDSDSYEDEEDEEDEDEDEKYITPFGNEDDDEDNGDEDNGDEDDDDENDENILRSYQ